MFKEKGFTAGRGKNKQALNLVFILTDSFQNAFWELEGSDVHKAVSWDRLHGYNNGLFSDHIWELFKKILEQEGHAL